MSQSFINPALLIDLMQRSIMHHVLWYTEIEHQYGREKAYEILQQVLPKTLEIQINRLGKTFGFEVSEGIPETWQKLSKEELTPLLQAISVNWLANDGIWFQAVEQEKGMTEAKRCNDSCWARFSFVEGNSVKSLLGLAKNPGLEGLRHALDYRLYSFINQQSFTFEQNCLILYMNDCRVQSARKRKGLEDYPCKSAGLIEYSAFAEAIDNRIKTVCVACPPDAHPEEWFCAWKFFIP